VVLDKAGVMQILLETVLERKLVLWSYHWKASKKDVIQGTIPGQRKTDDLKPCGCTTFWHGLEKALRVETGSM